jgi:hypothetical protein
LWRNFVLRIMFNTILAFTERIQMYLSSQQLGVIYLNHHMTVHIHRIYVRAMSIHESNICLICSLCWASCRCRESSSTRSLQKYEIEITSQIVTLCKPVQLIWFVVDNISQMFSLYFLHFICILDRTSGRDGLQL